MFLFIHIAAGSLALMAGTVAFSVKKGGYIHKKSGLFFVVSMLVMASSGGLLAATNNEKLNALAGGLTFYLVATAFLKVSRLSLHKKAVIISLTVFALLLGIWGIYTGVATIYAGADRLDGQPMQVLFVFSGMALLGSALDIKCLLAPINGKQRMMRHIWRMGTSMFLATASFFLGQSQTIPEVMRTPVLLITPVVLVLILTFYYLLRTAISRRFRR